MTTSSADRGVGVSTGEMTVRTTLSPGRGYVLPSIGVINTGDEAGEYQVSIGYLNGQAQERPSAQWFSFEPERFALGSGESIDVVARIVVPADARAGDYFALIRAQTVSQTGEQTSLGIAAATKIQFAVESSSWFSATLNTANRWLDDAAPWTYLVPGALLLGWLASRAGRLPFRFRVERK